MPSKILLKISCFHVFLSGTIPETIRYITSYEFVSLLLFPFSVSCSEVETPPEPSINVSSAQETSSYEKIFYLFFETKYLSGVNVMTRVSIHSSISKERKTLSNYQLDDSGKKTNLWQCYLFNFDVFPRVIICPKKENIEISHRIDNLFKFNSYLIDTITWFAHEESNLNFEFVRILQHKKTEFGKLGVNIIHMRQFPANS